MQAFLAINFIRQVIVVNRGADIRIKEGFSSE